MQSFSSHYYVNIRDTKAHFVRFGESSNKIIFLHGWGGSTESFTQLAVQLREKKPDLEIILLDYPGFGLTGNPPEAGMDSSEYAAWVYDFMTVLNIPRAHFYAHSNGGRILNKLIQKNPQAVKKAVFTGSAGIKPPKKIGQIIAEKIGFIGKILPKSVRRFLIKKVLGARDWADVKPYNKKTLERILAEPDIGEELKKITHECLILWGAKDKMTPYRPSGETYIKNIKNKQYKVFPDGRHGIHHTHTNEIADLVAEFLK